MLRSDLAEFDRVRSRSPLCRLLLGDSDLISRNNDGFEQCSVAFAAVTYGHFVKLDDLLIRFDIEKRATKKFKGDLREAWLQERDIKKSRNKFQRVMGALTEIVAANFISNTEELKRLSFIDESCKADIESLKGGNPLATEVKFIGEQPDLADQMAEAAQNGGVAVGFIEGADKLYNYIAFRIAEAVAQFERIKVPLGERRVFIVFYHAGQLEPIVKEALRYLKDRLNWIRAEEWRATFELLNSKGNVSLETPVVEYLDKAGKIICGQLKEYEIQDFQVIC